MKELKVLPVVRAFVKIEELSLDLLRCLVWRAFNIDLHIFIMSIDTAAHLILIIVELVEKLLKAGSKVGVAFAILASLIYLSFLRLQPFLTRQLLISIMNLQILSLLFNLLIESFLMLLICFNIALGAARLLMLAGGIRTFS